MLTSASRSNAKRTLMAIISATFPGGVTSPNGAKLMLVDEQGAGDRSTGARLFEIEALVANDDCAGVAKHRV